MKRKEILVTLSAAFALAMSAELAATDAVTTFSVDAGYRHGHAKRNIALNINTSGLYPGNLTGNLKHNTKYNLWDVQLWSRTVIEEQYLLKANIGWGRVYKASETMDCRNVKFGGQINNATPYQQLWGRKRDGKKKKHGHACNALLGLGYILPINDSLAIVPSVGFEFQEMQIKHYMNDSFVNKANAKQKERWSGGFVGLEAPINFDCGLKLVPGVQYTFAKYKTSTHNKPKGGDGRYYYHGSKMGHIIKASLDAFMPINDQLTFNAGYSFERKTAKPKLKTDWIGNATASFMGSGKDNKGKIKVNEHSFNLGLTLLY